MKWDHSKTWSTSGNPHGSGYTVSRNGFGFWFWALRRTKEEGGPYANREEAILAAEKHEKGKENPYE